MLENITKILELEKQRQLNTISLIASENIASYDVRKAQGSIFTNKYAEGYPGLRYYAGCEYADEIESLAIDLAKQIFNAQWVNVQPHSGSQANEAVYNALLNPGDTILSLSLQSGGHLTHGAKASCVSKFYKIINYSIDETGYINLEEVEKLALEHRPKLIITGASAYPRLWNWAKFREIANKSGSLLLADVAHTAGLIAARVHENPINYVDVMTSTTHKTLRGARGGMIFSNNKTLGEKIDKALFPGIQGGPLMHVICAKAVGFSENLTPEFQEYGKKILENAKILEKELNNVGIKMITNGTDNHLLIVDCRSFGLDGKSTERLLKAANINVSVSALKEDISWLSPSGIRIGTPYATTLGVNMQELASLLAQCLKTQDSTELGKYDCYTANKLMINKNLLD